MKLLFLSVFGLLCLFSLPGCGKESVEFKSDPVAAYMPLEIGREFRYRLDSLKFINFGLKDTVVRYQIRDVVDARFTDAEGDTVYRMIRSIRDSAQTSESAWRPNGTYSITVQAQTITEQDPNNFRIQKLKLPITMGMSWRGNSALVSSPYAGLYDFTIDADIQNWAFYYLGVNQSVKIGAKNYDQVITVEAVNDSSNIAQIPRFVASRRWVQEQYALGVGLISRDVVFWEFQPIVDPNGGVPKTGYYDGFGVKMRLIEVR